MGRRSKEGYSDKALNALKIGQYDELTGRSSANGWRPSKITSVSVNTINKPKKVSTSVSTSQRRRKKTVDEARNMGKRKTTPKQSGLNFSDIKRAENAAKNQQLADLTMIGNSIQPVDDAPALLAPIMNPNEKKPKSTNFSDIKRADYAKKNSTPSKQEVVDALVAPAKERETQRVSNLPSLTDQNDPRYRKEKQKYQGYPSSYRRDRINFDNLLTNGIDPGAGITGYTNHIGITDLENDLKARQEGKDKGGFMEEYFPYLMVSPSENSKELEKQRNDLYNLQFGMSKDQVLDQYEEYKKQKEKTERVLHPYRTGFADFASAPDRALAGLGNFLEWAFPGSDLSGMANSDLAQREVKDVQEKRDYVYDSDILTDRQKENAQTFYNTGDFITNAAVAGALGGGFAAGDAATGTGMIVEPAKWVTPAAQAAFNYGNTANQTVHELEKQGIDHDTAVEMANASGAISAAAGYAFASGNAGKAGASVIKKALMRGGKAAAIGLTEAGANEAANRLILGDQGTFAKEVEYYMSQGMSEEQAGEKAGLNVLARIGGTAAMYGITGAVPELVKGGIGALRNIKATPGDPYADLNNYFYSDPLLGMGTEEAAQAAVPAPYSPTAPQAMNGVAPTVNPYVNALVNGRINDFVASQVNPNPAQLPAVITDTNVNSQNPAMPETPINTEVAENVGEIPPADVISQEVPEPNYRWGETADALISPDSYARQEDFTKLEQEIKDKFDQINDLNDQRRALEKELSNEKKGLKPKDQWTDAEKINELVFGDVPYEYSDRAPELERQIADINKQIRELEKSRDLLIEDRDYIDAQERIKQIESYKQTGLVPATRNDYVGFDITKGGMSGDLERGKARLVEMSPEEYIRRCAYEIFKNNEPNPTTLESVLSTREQASIDEYAQRMLAGEKAPTPYLNYNTSNQEGLHRALAAMKAGIDVIPVMVEGNPPSYGLDWEARNLVSDINLSRLDRELDELGYEPLPDDDLIPDLTAPAEATPAVGESAPVDGLIGDIEPEANLRNYSDEQIAEIKAYEEAKNALRAQMNSTANIFDANSMQRLNELSAQSKALDAEMQGKYPELFTENGKFTGMPEQNGEVTPVNPPQNNTGESTSAPVKTKKKPEENGGGITTPPVNTPSGENGNESPKYGKSRVVNNTGRHSGVISDYEYENNPTIKEIERYVKANNEKSFNTAMENVKEHGEELLDAYIDGSKRITSDESVDEAMLLLTNLKARMDRKEDVGVARDLLLSRLTAAGTTYGQIIQAFAKWNDTSEGAMINAIGLNSKRVERWKSTHEKQAAKNEEVAGKLANIVNDLQNEEAMPTPAEYDGTNISNGANYNPQNGEANSNATSPRLTNALRQNGYDGTMDTTKTPKTHEQHRLEVENTIKKELGSVASQLNDNDYEVLTNFVENNVPTETIEDEIRHRLTYGEWYTIDESTPVKKEISSKLASVFKDMGNDSRKAANKVDNGYPAKSHATIVNEVRNTITDELASLGLGTDTDIEFMTSMVEAGVPKWKMEDEIQHRLATGEWYTLDESIPEKKPTSAALARIFKRMGDDTRKPVNGAPDLDYPEKNHANIVEEVKNTLAEDAASLGLDKPSDAEFLAIMLEEGVPEWQIEDEITHRLMTGEWYTLDESIEEKKPIDQKLMSAINSLKEPPASPIESVPPSLDEIRERVRNTFDVDFASTVGGRKDTLAEITDADVDYFANMINNGATKEELAAILDKKFATGSVGISKKTQDFVNQMFTEADYFDPNSKEACVRKAAAYKALADECIDHATPFEVFEAWRYLAMLGNPKTWIKNFVGNVGFNGITGMSNSLAAVFEAAMDKASKARGGEGIERTKAILNMASQADRALVAGSFADSKETRWLEMTGDKYREGNVKGKIRKQRSVFRTKLVRGAEKVVQTGVSDTLAVRTKYATSLAGWLKANGYDVSVFEEDMRYRAILRAARSNVLSDKERAELERLKPLHDAIEKGRDYAVKEAEYATFHEQNDVAEWINKVSNTAPGFLFRALVEGNIPFKNTTMNIVRSALELSPVNLLNDIYRLYKYKWEHNADKDGGLADQYKKRDWRGNEKTVNRTTEADLASGWSKTITGSTLMAIGFWLADLGLLHVSDDDEKYQDELEGKQNYSIKLGDHTYTLDWTTPWGTPMLAGASLKNIKDRLSLGTESLIKNFSDIVSVTNEILNPIMEMTFLQGFNDTLSNTFSAYDENRHNVGGAIGGLLASSVANYLSQAVPTSFGQSARVIDPVRRTSDTITDNTNPALKSWEKQGRKLLNKLPWLSMLNTPYINARGEQELNSPTDNRFLATLYQFLSPSYIDEINTTEADQMARDVFNSTVENEDGTTRMLRDIEAFPEWKSSVKDGDHYFTPEETQTYRTESGQKGQEIRTALAHEEWFNHLSGQRRDEILKKVNNLVEKIGKEAAGYPQDDSALDVYKTGGIPDLLEYYRKGDYKKDIKNQTDLAPNSKASVQIQEAREEGYVAEPKNFSDIKRADYANAKADKLTEDAVQILERGFTKDGVTATYQQAKSVVPDLTYDDFATQYREIDGADGTEPNERLSQDEIIKYLNDGMYSEAVKKYIKQGKSEEDARDLALQDIMPTWNMYASGKAQPYIRRDGTLGKH